MSYTLLHLDDIQKIFNHKRISVVCNGSSVFTGDYADIIDSADVVIRFNNGCFIYRNYPEKLGKRCDIQCLSGYYYPIGSALETFKNVKRDNSNLPILFSRPLQVTTDSMRYNGLYVRKEYIPVVNSRDVFFMPSSILETYNFTSGMTIILFLLKYTQFQQLNIFGMDFYKGIYHYWDDEINTEEIINHNTVFEEYLTKLIKQTCNNFELY